MGLYLCSFELTVRTPHPENESSSINVLATRSARSGEAIFVYRQCPAFDARTLQGFFRPSSASAYVEMSSHQNLASNFCCSRRACALSSFARFASPKACASVAAWFLAANTYPCTSQSAIGGSASDPSAWKTESLESFHPC